MNQWNDAYDAGHRAARRELAPLVEAVIDALLMFKDIEKARQLPPFPDVQQQYVAMGRQLERLLRLSGLGDVVRQHPLTEDEIKNSNTLEARLAASDAMRVRD